MLKMKRISETYDMKVFTDTGEYFGDVEESILTQNKVFGWRVRATKTSFLNKVLGSAKGVIVPNPEEVEDYKWINIGNLKNEIKENPGIFTSWFKIALNRVLNYLEKKK